MTASNSESRDLRRSPAMGWLIGLVVLPMGASVVCAILFWGCQLRLSCSSALLASLLLIASVTDLRSRKIPNWLTYSVFAWSLALNLLAAEFAPRWIDGSRQPYDFLGGVGIANSLVGAGVCFAAMLFGYLLSGTGAGDVKLMGAVGGLTGLSEGLNAVLWGYIVAGVGIVVWQILGRHPLRLMRALGRRIGYALLPTWIAAPAEEEQWLLRRPVPLAAAFAIGTLITSMGGKILVGGVS